MSAREFRDLFRHRYMLFFYFGAALVGVIGSTGDGSRAPLEITLTLASLQVLAGVAVMAGIAAAMLSVARITGRVAVVRLGWMLAGAVGTAVAAAEFSDRWFLRQAPTPRGLLVAQAVFYGVLAMVSMSVLLQFTVRRMLEDMRKSAESEGEAAQARPPAPDRPEL